MHSLISLSLLSLVPLVAGCVGGEEPPELPIAYLEGNPPVRIDASPGRLSLWFSHTVNDDGCRRLADSFTATVNGTPIGVQRGSVEDIGLDSTEWWCTPPSGSFQFVADTAELVLTDETRSVTIDLGTSLALREMTVVDSVWTRGNAHAVTWTPTADLAAQHPSAATLNAPNANAPTSTVVASVTHETDQVLVTVPATAPVGAADVTLSWATTTMPCTNCTLVQNGSVTRSITVQ